MLVHIYIHEYYRIETSSRLISLCKLKLANSLKKTTQTYLY